MIRALTLLLFGALSLCGQYNAQALLASQKIAAAGGSVTLDVVGAGASPCCSGTTVTAAHTITNALTNTAVIGIVAWQQDSSTVSGCTWNGTTMTAMWNFRETLVNFQGSAGFILATGTGDGVSHNLVCTFGGTIANGAALMTYSVTGANQSTPFRTAFTTQADTLAGSISLTVSNAVTGDFVIDGLSITNSASSTSTQTSRSTKINVGGNSWSGQTSSAAPSGSVNMGYTFATTEFFIAFGAAAIRP